KAYRPPAHRLRRSAVPVPARIAPRCHAGRDGPAILPDGLRLAPGLLSGFLGMAGDAQVAAVRIRVAAASRQSDMVVDFARISDAPARLAGVAVPQLDPVIAAL